MMFDDPAMKHEGDVFCDIGGEVGDALEGFGVGHACCWAGWPVMCAQ